MTGSLVHDNLQSIYVHVANKICFSYVTNIPKEMGLACDTFVVSYLKTLDMPFLRLFFLKLRTEINDTMTLNQYITLQVPKCIHEPNLEFKSYMKYRMLEPWKQNVTLCCTKMYSKRVYVNEPFN